MAVMRLDIVVRRGDEAGGLTRGVELCWVGVAHSNSSVQQIQISPFKNLSFHLQGLKARQIIAQGKRDEVRAALGKSSNRLSQSRERQVLHGRFRFTRCSH
jgi:hypothetical protein